MQVLGHLEVTVLEIDAAPGEVEGLEVLVTLEVHPVEARELLQDGGILDVVAPAVELPDVLEIFQSGDILDAAVFDVDLLDCEGFLEGDEVVAVFVGDGKHVLLEGLVLEGDHVFPFHEDVILPGADDEFFEFVLRSTDVDGAVSRGVFAVAGHIEGDLPDAGDDGFDPVHGGVDGDAPFREVRPEEDRSLAGSSVTEIFGG